MRKAVILAILMLSITLLAGFDYKKEQSNKPQEKGWIQKTDKAPFSGRVAHSTVVFKNKIFVIGGWDGKNVKNDIWSSSDGKTWTLVREHSPFRPRGLHTTIAFKNKLWIIGGICVDKNNDFNDLNDIWVSDDGKNWQNITKNASFPKRGGHSIIVYKNKLWLIGGIACAGDVWSSTDGKNWVQVVKDTDFLRRGGHSSVVFNNKIWVIGGFSINNKNSFNDFNNLWYSTDGKNWTEATNNNRFLANAGHAGIVHDNKIYIIGGFRMKGRVICSTNAIDWDLNTVLPPYGERVAHSSVVFKDKIWLIGGYDWKDNKSDVWYLVN